MTMLAPKSDAASTSKLAFATLVKARYVDQGMTAHTALALVHVRSGVSLGALWSAYRGFRVAPDTAARLREWAFVEHGEELDVEPLMIGPKRPRRRKA